MSSPSRFSSGLPLPTKSLLLYVKTARTAWRLLLVLIITLVYFYGSSWWEKRVQQLPRHEKVQGTQLRRWQQSVEGSPEDGPGDMGAPVIWTTVEDKRQHEEDMKRWRERNMQQLLPEKGHTSSRQWQPSVKEKSAEDGPGDMGTAVILTTAEDKRQHEEDMKRWFMSVVASDKILLDRRLPDVRMPECLGLSYDSAKLPKATAVIIFTDEAWSPLLRTVHSVMNRSPPELLAEVLLIDDYSQRDELKTKLETHIARFEGKVRLLRLKERHGLIRAKLEGAKAAQGEVVVFFDSHCEANEGWLEPLLARIAEKRSAVVCPMIDGISAADMSYSGAAHPSWIGGFWWSLHFSWEPIPERILSARQSPTDPIPLPTMLGGELAANRDYFLEVGGYDPGMDIWGGENLELPFRVWMCGGSVELIPCSHVGHIFRENHPYNMTGPGGNTDVHGTNSKRLAEVWMDDYKRLFYLHRPDLIDKEVGPLEERKELRKRLKCKSFKWYLDNVIPNKFVLDDEENVVGYGSVNQIYTLLTDPCSIPLEFRNAQTGLCLDTLQSREELEAPLGVFDCQKGGSSAQLFSLTKSKQFRREVLCADIGKDVNTTSATATVVLALCGNGESLAQMWILQENGLMRNERTGLCMDAEGAKNSDNLKLQKCDSNKPTQKWEFIHESNI